MNSRTGKMLVCGAAAVAVFLFSANAQAAPWTDPSGGNAHFTYDTGQDINGHFGDPLLAGDTFIFDSASLGVSTQYGGHDSLTDTVSWNIHVLPGFTLTGLEVRVYGDYLLQGVDSHVDLDATLRLEEFEAQGQNPDPRVYTDSLTTTPVLFPLWYSPSLPEPNTYSGTSEVNISGQLPGVDNDLKVSFTDLVEAWADVNGVANLNMNFQSMRFEITLIPEPTALVLMVLGAFALLRRR